MKITKTAQFLKIFLNGLVLHALLCVVDFYTIKYSGNLYLISGGLTSLVIAFVGELVVKKIKSNFVSLLVSVLIGAFAMCLTFFSVLPGMNVIFSVLVFTWLMLYRHNKAVCNMNYAHKSFVLIFIFMFLIATGFDIGKMVTLSVAEGIAFLIINLFLSGVFSHEKFIAENRSVQNFPEEQIRKTYFSLLAVFSLVCLAAVVIIISVNLPTEAITDAIGDALHNFYEALPEFKDAPGVAKEGRIESAQYEQALIDFGFESKQNVALEAIVTAICMIIMVFVILFAAIYFIRRIVAGLMLTKIVGADKLEFASANDTYSKIKREKNVFSDKGNDRKIRKLYKKYMLKATKKNLRKSDTPGVLQKKTETENEKSEIIRRIYEKARYSNEECTAEDTILFKRSLK